MRKFSYFAMTLLLLVLAIYLNSCAATKGGGLIDPTDPIIPSPEIKDGTVDPRTRAITMTKEGVTVIVEHWSRTRVNNKYTNVDTRSPFYYLETWEQAYSSEVFHVTIKNETDRNVVIEFKDVVMVDERKYEYRPITISEIKDKFVTKKMMDLKTNKGLSLAYEIMLNESHGNRRPIRPGKTVEGFVAFNLPSTLATKLYVRLVIEKAPVIATGSYERLEFRYDYLQDAVKRTSQPVIKR